MKREVKPSYRMSPNELERFLKDEKAKNRKIRLLQVRQQAKENAKKILHDVQKEKAKQIRKLTEQTRVELEQERSENVRQLEELYEENIRHVGEAHANAAYTQLETREQEKARFAKEREQALRHKQRSEAALVLLRQQQQQRYEEETRQIQARKAALAEEKERAAVIASMPAPEPNPVDSIKPLQMKPVKFTDLDAFSTTHLHLNENYGVTREAETEQPDAKAVAEDEGERYKETEEERARVANERREKARLRHNHALHKELTKNDYNHLLHELSDLQREDRDRRQKALQHIPKNIYVPPSRHREEKEEQQRDMERAFEDMYLTATDRMGDLSLALDPHPAPETPSATETLDLSTLDDGSLGDSYVPAAAAEEDTQQTAAVKTALMEEDPETNPGLRKLLSRIKGQRDQWVKTTQGEEPRSIKDQTTADATLTQYTMTSSNVSDVDTLSTGEVESKSARSDSTLATQEVVTSEKSLESGSVTTSGTISSEQQGAQTLVHPLEQAAQIRQRPSAEASRVIRHDREQVRVNDELRNQQLEEQKRSLQETLREIELRKRMLEQRYQENQRKFQQNMGQAPTDLQPASNVQISQTAPLATELPVSSATSSSMTSQSVTAPTMTSQSMTSQQDGLPLDKVHDYQRRVLQRQGDKIQQLRQAKQDLDDKVQAMLSKAATDYNAIPPSQQPSTSATRDPLVQQQATQQSDMTTPMQPQKASPHSLANLDQLGPYSDISPQFNADTSSSQLPARGAQYGAPPSFPSLFSNTSTQYASLPTTRPPIQPFTHAPAYQYPGSASLIITNQQNSYQQNVYQNGITSIGGVTSQSGIASQGTLNLRENPSSGTDIMTSQKESISSASQPRAMQYMGSMPYQQPQPMSSTSADSNVLNSGLATEQPALRVGEERVSGVVNGVNVPPQPASTVTSRTSHPSNLFPSYASTQYMGLPMQGGVDPGLGANLRRDGAIHDANQSQGANAPDVYSAPSMASYQALSSTNQFPTGYTSEPSIASFRSLGLALGNKTYDGFELRTKHSTAQNQPGMPYHADISGVSDHSQGTPALEESVKNTSQLSRDSQISRDSFISRERDDFNDNVVRMRAELEEIRRQKAEILVRQQQHDAEMESMRKRWEAGADELNSLQRVQGTNVAEDGSRWEMGTNMPSTTYGSTPLSTSETMMQSTRLGAGTDMGSQPNSYLHFGHEYSPNITANEPDEGTEEEEESGDNMSAPTAPVPQQTFDTRRFVPHELSTIQEVLTPNVKMTSSQETPAGMRTTWHDVLAEESHEGSDITPNMAATDDVTSNMTSTNAPLQQTRAHLGNFNWRDLISPGDQVHTSESNRDVNLSGENSMPVYKSESTSFQPLAEDPEQTLKSSVAESTIPRERDVYLDLDESEGTANASPRPLSSTPAKTSSSALRSEVRVALPDYSASPMGTKPNTQSVMTSQNAQHSMTSLTSYSSGQYSEALQKPATPTLTFSSNVMIPTGTAQDNTSSGRVQNNALSRPTEASVSSLGSSMQHKQFTTVASSLMNFTPPPTGGVATPFTSAILREVTTSAGHVSDMTPPSSESVSHSTPYTALQSDSPQYAVLQRTEPTQFTTLQPDSSAYTTLQVNSRLSEDSTGLKQQTLGSDFSATPSSGQLSQYQLGGSGGTRSSVGGAPDMSSFAFHPLNDRQSHPRLDSTGITPLAQQELTSQAEAPGMQLSSGRLSGLTDSSYGRTVTESGRSSMMAPDPTQYTLNDDVTVNNTRTPVVRFAPGGPDVLQMSSGSSQPGISQRSDQSEPSLLSQNLNNRISATLQKHDDIIAESRRMAVKHEQQMYDYSNIKPLHFTQTDGNSSVQASPVKGILDEAEITLVSAADDSEFATKQPESFEASLLSFEQHESSLQGTEAASSYNVKSSLQQKSSRIDDQKSNNSLSSFERNERTLLGESSPEPSYVHWTQGSSPMMLPLQPDASQASMLFSQPQASQQSQGSLGDEFQPLHEEYGTPDVDHFSGKHVISIPIAHVDDPDESADSVAGLSLAEAFARKRKNFAGRSEKRREQAKHKAEETSKQHTEMNKLVSNWKKKHTLPKSSAKGAKPAAAAVAESVTKGDEDRKQAQREMKERTSRLYSLTEEAKLRKAEEDKKKVAAQNRERAQQYNKKLHEKKLKKAASKK